MGFFKEVGRQVEQFKRTAREAADEEETRQCGACGTRSNADYDECPECGAPSTEE
ncbi:hypothetical protein [Halorarum halobium]|uniref:hypothetical protein n=1 Tax=Halorarum halobium TaxID=3075121 RepID=UPI0028B2564B|nr:hypothetical protein [Halobaculum sp. XH14]